MPLLVEAGARTEAALECAYRRDAADAPASAPPPPLLPPEAPAVAAPPSSKQVAEDRLFAAVGVAVWGASAMKISPHMTLANNLQSTAGLVAIFTVALLWPSLRPRSYERWRVPALAALRLFLICLPINYDSAVFDALAPGVATGRLAWVVNVSHLLQGTHVLLLFFPALDLPLPLRVHMLLQAAKLLVLVSFGVHPHCRSKLLTSPQAVAAVASAHHTMASLVFSVVPLAVSTVPEDAYGQRVAALLFVWVVAGWLLPTLVLMLPEVAGRRARRRQGRRDRSGAQAHGPVRNGPCAAVATWVQRGAAALESWLRELLMVESCAQPGESEGEEWGERGDQILQLPPAGVLCVRWFVLAILLWVSCCAVAPLFVPPAIAPLHAQV